jgi:hypothetical protein
MNLATRAGSLIFVLLVALHSGPPVPAAGSSDWSSLKQIAPGQRLKVSLADGRSLQGDLNSVEDNAILIHMTSGDQSFARENVRRVAVKRAGHRGRHALLGAAIGAGAGLGVGIAIDNDCSSTSIVCTGNKGKAVGTPLFALLGAGIAALLPAGAWHELYRTP